jgi:hypothetical protein
VPRVVKTEAIAPTLEQVARNLRGSGRSSANGRVHVRLRGLEPVAGDGARPVVLGEVTRDFATGAVVATS